jgi:hypothetical protein
MSLSIPEVTSPLAGMEIGKNELLVSTSAWRKGPGTQIGAGSSPLSPAMAQERFLTRRGGWPVGKIGCVWMGPWRDLFTGRCLPDREGL